MTNASDRHTTPDASPREGIDRAAQRKATRKIPPLVWVVVAGFVLWAIIAFVQRDRTDVTPQGGTMPMAKEETTVMPASPPSGTTPGTPTSTGQGPASQ